MNDEINQGYRHVNGVLYLLQLHFIWLPRRRRKVLIGPVAERLDTLLREKAVELDVDVMQLDIQPDHIHLFVGVDPQIAPAQIAYRLKSYTARRLRQEFPPLCTMPSMWTTSYFVSSADTVSDATIDQYIQSQSTRA